MEVHMVADMVAVMVAEIVADKKKKKSGRHGDGLDGRHGGGQGSSGDTL